MAGEQEHRQVAASSPLPKDDCGCGDPKHPWCDTLVFKHMTAHEELGRMFRFEVELVSSRDDLVFEKVLGHPMTIRLDLADGDKRYFNGVVSEFAQVGRSDRHFAYKAILRPWLWFLTRTADCRIFPDKADARKLKVADIILAVFRKHGFSDVQNELVETDQYKEWEHCVQYRETDFNFVQRLMEHEGIYYYFKHEETKHTLVLCDDYGSHGPVEGCETVPYFHRSDDEVVERNHIHRWSVTKAIQPGLYALNEFDFMRPRADLEVKEPIQREHEHADFEVYDYPGKYVEPADGTAEEKENNEELRTAYQKFAKNRIQELHAGYETVNASGNVRALHAGALFTLEDPREVLRPDQRDREVLIVAATYDILSDAFGAGGTASGEAVYSLDLTAIDARQPFRLPRKTPKPVIRGPQTAMVVGKSGEEIWTDKYGRVKVQFHWDRYSQKDEKSSCWVRVAQIWSGKNWGGIHIPRIGQEVIVEFLEGDPDRPIITGSVYNDDNLPPYTLPDNQTQSGVKSRSSKGGGPDNFNEIRFEDKKGEEQVFVQAEKDMTVSVKNNRSVSVGNDSSEAVTRNKTISVDGTHTENIKGDTHVNVTEGMMQTQVKKALYASSDTEDVVMQSFTKMAHFVGKTESLLSGEQKAKVLSTAGPVEVDGSTQVLIKCGETTITVTSSEITVHGTSKVTIDGNGKTVTCDGSGVSIDGGGTVVANSSGVTISGGLVKLNA